MKLADKITFDLLHSIQNSSYEIVIPNFFLGAFEMDLFRMMKSGYIYEYEIKISRADYFSDFKKHRKIYSGYGRDRTTTKILKHDDIAKGLGKQNRFFFVVPEGLLAVSEIPEYAGLIEYNEEFGRFREVKIAPLIHRNKVDSLEFYKGLATSLSFREASQRLKNMRLKTQFENYKKREKNTSL